LVTLTPSLSRNREREFQSKTKSGVFRRRERRIHREKRNCILSIFGGKSTYLITLTLPLSQIGRGYNSGVASHLSLSQGGGEE
jgi:hypothetical protein